MPEWNYIKDNLETIPGSSHYILTLLHRVNSMLLRVEGYYKDYRSLVTIENGNVNTNGSGYAKGADIFFKQEKSKIGIEYWKNMNKTDYLPSFLEVP